MKKTMKKTIAVTLMLMCLLSTCVLHAAAATPSLGNCLSQCTLYNNSNNNNNLTRSAVIPVKNYSKNYSYKAQSSNKSVATVSGSVNSKTGVTITIRAKSRGSATITVSINNASGKCVSSKKIAVTVYPHSIDTPKNLKASSISRNSAVLTWNVNSTAYISCYKIQISSDNRSWKNIGTSKTNAVRLNNLAAGSRSYFRVVAISNLEDGSYLNSFSASLRVVTKN